MRCTIALLFLWSMAVASGRAAEAPAAVDDAPLPGTSAFFVDRIVPILEHDCLRCHGEARQKGGLKLNSRDAILAGGKSGPAIVLGDPERSLLITAVRYGDPDLQMPPDDRLTSQQIADLAAWIAHGAPWRTAAPTPPTAGAAAATAAAVAPSATAATTAAAAPSLDATANHRPPLVGRLHPLVIHFPIACLMLGVLAELLRWWRGAGWEPAVRLLVFAGAAGAVVAVATGTWFAQDGTAFHRGEATLSRHEIIGWFALTGALIGSGLLLTSHAYPRLRWAFRAALLASAGLAGLAGHFGGEMIYGAHWLF